jgi:hypothetical protein
LFLSFPGFGDDFVEEGFPGEVQDHAHFAVLVPEFGTS